MPDWKNNPVFSIKLFPEKIFIFIFPRPVKVVFFKDIPGSMKPECYHYLRVYKFNFLVQVSGAFFNFIFLRYAAFRKITFDKVSYINILPLDLCILQQPVKYLP